MHDKVSEVKSRHGYEGNTWSTMKLAPHVSLSGVPGLPAFFTFIWLQALTSSVQQKL